MIFDKIENINRYSLPQYKFKRLIEFFNQYNLDSFQKGKFKIDTDSLFGIGLQYATKSADECLWEAHRKYIDVHIILEGEELVFINDIANMTISTSYNETEDVELFEGYEKHQVVLKKGNFLILYPNEVHKTSMQLVGKSSYVTKNVYKLKFNK